MTELYHHGVKGQKWGVRRYQYADGSLTPAGRKRYANLQNGSTTSKVARRVSAHTKETINNARTRLTGKQYVDGYLNSGTTLHRIQTSENFEHFAFYATYKKHDSEEYMGLFGKNLTSRVQAEARRAERAASKSGDETDVAKAKELREKADNTKVYQLTLEATKKLKIPSDENASDITASLLKEKEFKDNVIASINDSKQKMIRPTQQVLFNQALNALERDTGRLTSADKTAIYKAFNLSLVNHNEQEVAAQNRFYSEMKKKGYNALLDYNDKEFSSYHAKRPVIVFDVDSVKLQAVTQTNPKVVDKLYSKYNTERIIKDIPTNSVGLVARLGSKTVAECQSYVKNQLNDYLDR